MKTKNIMKGVAAVLLTGALASCSSDYLQNAPITELPTEEALSTTKACQMAVYGMARAMCTQYQDISSPRGMNGEATLNTSINEALCPDFVSYFYMRELGKNWYTWTNMNNAIATNNSTAWMYCYNFINQANGIISNIATAEGEDYEKEYIEAQARTYRAFGYIKALQWFGPRWQDSNNGEKKAVVYREEQSSLPAPLGTMNQVLNLIYSDLDRAIALFNSCGVDRENCWEVNLPIAYGLYARAALIKNDWKTAQTMAHNARQGFTLMDADTFFEGFVDETPSIMWTNQDNDIYYSSYGAWSACTGNYHVKWGLGDAIALDLYNKLDANDIRREVFFTPDKVATVSAMPGYEAAAKVTPDDFWSAKYVAAAGVNCYSGSPATPMDTLALGFAKYAQELNPYYAYCPYAPYATSNKVGKNGFLPVTSMMLGASTKMWGLGYYGDSKYPYMRAEEMVLTEAEAAYMAGDEVTAKKCLTELNSLRIEGYVCTTSGAALLEEIKTSRRVELWGEGFGFPDYKRWNVKAETRKWVAGDPTSGNCPADYVISKQPSDNNGWRLAIPQSETDFNPLAKQLD